MNVLELSNLSISYDGKSVIDNFSLSLREGEVLVLLGASGAGKSSVLKAIAGLIVVEGGEVSYRGEKLKGPDVQLIPGHEEIKLINQDFGLDVYHTVEENIRLRLLAYDYDFQKERVEELLQLTALNDLRNQTANLLSGGQKQRLAIARALANEPDLLLMDEPFNQLDFTIKSKLSDHIMEYIREHGISVIMVTHNGQEAMEWADRIAHISEGKLKRVDDAVHFYNEPDSLEQAEFFGAVNVLDLDGETCYFRPEDFSFKRDAEHSIPLSLSIDDQKKIAWFYRVSASLESQKYQLITPVMIEDVDEIFIKELKFND